MIKVDMDFGSEGFKCSNCLKTQQVCSFSDLPRYQRHFRLYRSGGSFIDPCTTSRLYHTSAAQSFERQESHRTASERKNDGTTHSVHMDQSVAHNSLQKSDCYGESQDDCFPDRQTKSTRFQLHALIDQIDDEVQYYKQKSGAFQNLLKSSCEKLMKSEQIYGSRLKSQALAFEESEKSYRARILAQSVRIKELEREVGSLKNLLKATRLQNEETFLEKEHKSADEIEILVLEM